MQGADMWWGEAHNEVARIWSRDHKRSRVKLKTQYLLFYKGYTITLGRVVTYDSLIMQLCEVTRSQNLKRKCKFISEWLIHIKKFKINILENKFTPKLISFRQSNLFLENFLIKNLSLTKISNMILTQFQAMLQFYTHLKHKKTRDQGGYKWRIGWK